MLGALSIERHFDDRIEAGADAPRCQHRDAPLDDAGFLQPTHPAQAGGRGDVQRGRQVLVGARIVALDQVQQATIRRVEIH